jgi:UDP:flavonoid glycosyltransferase YjiC (YdhE family)
MAEILFVTWDGGGNVPPAVGIAEELKSRGHHVRFMGHSRQAPRFAETGQEFTAFATARPFDSTVPTTPLTVLACFSDRAMGADVLAELEARPADVVVVDCLLFSVLDALHTAGRSYVALEHSFDTCWRRMAKGPFGLLLRLRGMKALALLDGGEPTMAATIPSLDTGHGDVVHTGPVVSGVPATPSRPTVLLSLSTFAFKGLEPTWQRILDAVAPLDARVIATTGPAVDARRLRVPANVELHSWLPHAEVMPEVSMVVGHGGHATTMVALAHDLPLLVIPMDAMTDQAFIGKAIERAGAGRTMGRKSSPEKIRAAIEKLLADGPHRAAAARLGAEVRSLPGAQLGADAVEALLSNGAVAPGRPSARS